MCPWCSVLICLKLFSVSSQPSKHFISSNFFPCFSHISTYSQLIILIIVSTLLCLKIKLPVLNNTRLCHNQTKLLLHLHPPSYQLIFWCDVIWYNAVLRVIMAVTFFTQVVLRDLTRCSILVLRKKKGFKFIFLI